MKKPTILTMAGATAAAFMTVSANAQTVNTNFNLKPSLLTSVRLVQPEPMRADDAYRIPPSEPERVATNSDLLTARNVPGSDVGGRPKKVNAGIGFFSNGYSANLDAVVGGKPLMTRIGYRR